MVLGLGSQGDQMAERANGSPGSPINQELMEPIELWSLVTSGTQQPWKPTGSPVPYGAHQVVEFARADLSLSLVTTKHSSTVILGSPINSGSYGAN